ncbi:methyltransferase [Asticcacaulis sp. 201]|uniref:class I SAM-dependent methyltransferase n=1 Tax=Asticcacaulis sp. 201 TaxID=3028787 RepID=UPI00291708FE|nr:methyltransferase [Asticcacaulis sp. 201]MDV6330523.1 methyltransferase [Asticcacaulis sp. 201]
MSIVNRREFARLGLGGAALLGLGVSVSACGRKPGNDPAVDPDADESEQINPKLAQQEGTLEWAVSGNWRNSVDKARDKYRHPIEMLTFFEVKPRDTVIDMWPGAGYMTEILAPYLARGKGRYVAAMFEASVTDTASTALGDKYKAHFDGNKKLYGQLGYAEFGANSTALLEADTADCILMLLVIQDWIAQGVAEKAFTDAFQALRPGGILGVEQHRADIGNVQDPGATNGYVQEPFVKQLAAEAGFQFVSSSEINANPKDDKDHPFGVWTLPPQRLTAPRGQPPNPEFDGTLYESIGESDRMTLKFRKPQ